MNNIKIIAGLLTVILTTSLFAASPITWQPPSSFNSSIAGLGLLQLEGITHYVIYDPVPSSANIDEGGSGIYESLEHGMFSHDAHIVLFKDKFIVYWNNHTRDENGPGQRVLAKVGTFDAAFDDIDWGGSETLAELVPQPAPLRRRTTVHDPDEINEHSGKGRLILINDKRLYVQGFVSARHGWTDDIQYESIQYSPVPTAHWSDEKTSTFKYDIGWDVGPNFYQGWRICNSGIDPATYMYIYSEQLATVEVTPGRFKTVLPTIFGSYATAQTFNYGPISFKNDMLNGTVTEFERIPLYASGTSTLAVDGYNGLAHRAEFQRPDGKWVVIRDNALNRGYYYAALKNNKNDYYPPAWQTNLYGDAMPAAGELPDSRVFIIGNSRDRQNMFITISSDGITFNKSWLLLHIAHQPLSGIGKSTTPSGPQYFKTALVKNNLWVVYSIAKEKIGVTRIPIGLLN